MLDFFFWTYFWQLHRLIVDMCDKWSHKTEGLLPLYYSLTLSLSGQCSLRGLTLLFLTCQTLQTSGVPTILRVPLLTMWTLLLRYKCQTSDASIGWRVLSLGQRNTVFFSYGTTGDCRLGCILLSTEKRWADKRCGILWGIEQRLHWLLDEESLGKDLHYTVHVMFCIEVVTTLIYHEADTM